MIRVAQVHRELTPDAVLLHGHVPRALDGIGKLPDDVVALLIGESLAVGL